MSVMILAADKGKATVIRDKNQFEEKSQKMLSDEKVYKVLKKTYKWLSEEAY